MFWLKDEANVSALDWIGQSCDLNPIENLWRELNQIIVGMEAATNLNDLAKSFLSWPKGETNIFQLRTHQ